MNSIANIRELLKKKLRSGRLRSELEFKIEPWGKPLIGMGGTGIAVDAVALTAPVRIQRKLERHISLRGPTCLLRLLRLRRHSRPAGQIATFKAASKERPVGGNQNARRKGQQIQLEIRRSDRSVLIYIQPEGPHQIVTA